MKKELNDDDRRSILKKIKEIVDISVGIIYLVVKRKLSDKKNK